MKNFFAKIFLSVAAIFALLANSFSPAEAVVVKGLAPIVNNDIDGAKKEARRQALRQAVEESLGVYVQSETKVENSMVVADEISMKSDGYVTIKRIISEGRQGEIYFIELDVDTSAEKIHRFAQDLKSQIEANVNDSNSRGGIITAVLEKNLNGSCKYDPTFGDYLNAKLKFAGFKASSNDNVTDYLIYHSSEPDVRLKARTIARENRESENALLRGVLEIDSVKKVGTFYEATVKASFEMIGLDSSEVDVFTKYVKGVASTEREAIFNAKEEATREAMESLAKQALETVQDERRGGSVNIKTTVVINNVTNYQAQYPLIKSGFDSAHCKIIRMTRPSTTSLVFFVSTDSYSNLGELETTLLELISGIQAGVAPQDALGATKIYLTF